MRCELIARVRLESPAGICEAFCADEDKTEFSLIAAARERVKSLRSLSEHNNKFKTQTGKYIVVQVVKIMKLSANVDTSTRYALHMYNLMTFHNSSLPEDKCPIEEINT